MEAMPEMTVAAPAITVPDPAVEAKPQRRRFTAEYKLRILREVERAKEPGEVGAILRREGLYSSHLVTWRRERDRVATAGLGGRVQFVGFVREPKPWFLQADLFVLPSEKEGMSNSLLEAMAVGMPVVATRIAGNESVITDGVDGVLVAPKDPEALAEAIIGLLKDQPRARTIGEHAQQTIAARFSLEGMVRRYREVLRA